MSGQTHALGPDVAREGLAVSLKGTCCCQWSPSWWEAERFCSRNYLTCIRLQIPHTDVNENRSGSDPRGTPLLHSSICPNPVLHLYCLLSGYRGISSSRLLQVLPGAPSSVISGFGDRVSTPPYLSHLLDSHRALLALIFLAPLACPPSPTAHLGDCLLFLQHLYCWTATSVPSVDNSLIL